MIIDISTRFQQSLSTALNKFSQGARIHDTVGRRGEWQGQLQGFFVVMCQPLTH